jgi:hypothetical protein
MRMFAAVLFLLAACSPPSAPAQPAPQGATAGSTGAGRVESTVFTLEPQAIVGRWSFDRSCGLYDLVFNADNSVDYYDYADESHVVSYGGRWSADHNRIALTLHRLNDSGAPSGDALAYAFDVSEPVTGDLIGAFGPDGGDMRNITAKRCPEEDRD